MAVQARTAARVSGQNQRGAGGGLAAVTSGAGALAHQGARTKSPAATRAEASPPHQVQK